MTDTRPQKPLSNSPDVPSSVIAAMRPGGDISSRDMSSQNATRSESREPVSIPSASRSLLERFATRRRAVASILCVWTVTIGGFSAWYTHDRQNVTSLKLLNPENAPNAWEQQALQSFEKGAAKAHMLVNENGRHFIRMMRPLYFDNYCVRCHQHQGYELGDVRGGVALTVPIDPLWQAETKQTSLVIAALAGIWFLGVAAVGLGSNAFQRVQLEQERTLDELRTNEYKMRAILDQTFHFIGVLDTSGHVIDVNQTALAFVGVRSSAVLNKPLWETPWWTHDAAQQTRLREAIQSAASGETVRLEVTHVAADGGLHYVDFSLRPVRDEAGSVICLIPEGHDLTDRKLAEARLEEQAALLRTVLDGIPDIVTLQDTQHNIISHNKAGRDLIERAPDQFRGDKCYEIIGRDKPCDGCTMTTAVATGKVASWQRFIPELQRWIRSTNIPILDKSGQITMVVEQFQDITVQENRPARTHRHRRKTGIREPDARRIQSVGGIGDSREE